MAAARFCVGVVRNGAPLVLLPAYLGYTIDRFVRDGYATSGARGRMWENEGAMGWDELITMID